MYEPYFFSPRNNIDAIIKMLPTEVESICDSLRQKMPTILLKLFANIYRYIPFNEQISYLV